MTTNNRLRSRRSGAGLTLLCLVWLPLVTLAATPISRPEQASVIHQLETDRTGWIARVRPHTESFERTCRAIGRIGRSSGLTRLFIEPHPFPRKR